MRKAGVESVAAPSAARIGRGFASVLRWADVRITSQTGRERHTKAASSTPVTLGVGAAEARAITREKKLNVNFRIQKSGRTAGKDDSGECLDLHILYIWRVLCIWQVGYKELLQALKGTNVYP